MMRFSERMGFKPVRQHLQVDTIDESLRNTLWNIFYGPFRKAQVIINEEWSSDFEPFFERLWIDFFRLPFDEMPRTPGDTLAFLKPRFLTANFCEVYDLLEAIVRYGCPFPKDEFKETCNKALNGGSSAYRFVGDRIAPVTDENELATIDEALVASDAAQLAGVKGHLETALAMLSDKKNPDYRNSIKESISAVESICRTIKGDRNAPFSDCLKMLEEKARIHPALKEAFTKIYGYASDEGGIRHAMFDKPNADSEDAKFMLVACSAFVNYLLVKAQKASIPFGQPAS